MHICQVAYLLGGGDVEFDPNQDRYPDIMDVIRFALKSEDFPEGDIERLEITLLANGEGTFRCWAARSEEPVGGVYLPD